MSSLNFGDVPYPRTILSYLYEMQRTRRMCDIILIAENEEIYVHKLILSAVSPYFSAITTTDFKENIDNKIQFTDISKCTLDSIVQFIYTGEIKVDENNVYELMAVAHRFQISLLKLAISNYLLFTLGSPNCLQILAYADLYSYEEIFAETLKFIATNFHFVVTKDIFLQAPPHVVKHVVCQRGLNLNAILNAFGKWLKFNNNITDFHFIDDLNLDQLNGICNKTKATHSELSDLISTVQEFVLTYYCDKDNKLLRKDIELKEKQLIISIGGFSNHTIQPTLESFTSVWSLSLPQRSAAHSEDILVIPAMGCARMLFSAVVSVREPWLVYVAGGLGPVSSGIALNSFERYDAEHNAWTSLQDMPVKLKAHTATWMDGNVVVLGGVNEQSEVVGDMWEYWVKNDCWRRGTPMLQPRADHGAVSVLGTLYAMGGRTCSGLGLPSMERYDPDVGAWSRVADLPETKFEFGCAAVNQYIYVIGGASKHFVHETVHRYDTLTDKWEECASMPTPKSGFGCTVRDGRIYCVGGRDNVHGPLATVEVFNPHTNRWHYTSDRLLTPRSFSCAVTVKVYVESDLNPS